MKKSSKFKAVMKNKIFLRLLFHVTGVTCLIWFLIRVIPAPHRSQYPCQQLSKSVAGGYIAIMGTMLYGVTAWLKYTKNRMAKLTPTLSVLFIITFLLAGGVFAVTQFQGAAPPQEWAPLKKDPMGTPQGVNPGRVVWVWDPEATERTLDGYWWKTENNNQEVTEDMYSLGLQGLTGGTNDHEAWDSLFRYFNLNHGKGDQGYQPGEKIAVKVNMNNCWNNRYNLQDNDRDASPYVVKALLRQLVNVVGVDQEDITVYDASRRLSDWFYYRVYYETYPATSLIPEFPQVNFVDQYGGATGRQQVIASDERIYFADDSGLYRTLPTCVSEAEYLINMPLLKRHPINYGVTLAGKNMFGTWMEPVDDVHEYHEAGFTENNPAPQVDLFAHDQIGGKTLLYIGDGIYATKIDHQRIDRFHMYPFNDDWTNSLFFSQDPVALDSVMFDFLYTEGTNPIEGSQQYLHQAAAPLENVYDPEDDGLVLDHSLGVHEHWDITQDIFSPARYSGPEGNGIDFVAIGGDGSSPAILITFPKENYLYVAGREITELPVTLILGNIPVETEINGVSGPVDVVEFYVDGYLQHSDETPPYSWLWDDPVFFSHILQVKAFYNESKTVENILTVWKFF